MGNSYIPLISVFPWEKLRFPEKLFPKDHCLIPIALLLMKNIVFTTKNMKIIQAIQFSSQPRRNAENEPV